MNYRIFKTPIHLHHRGIPREGLIKFIILFLGRMSMRVDSIIQFLRIVQNMLLGNLNLIVLNYNPNLILFQQISQILSEILRIGHG